MKRYLLIALLFNTGVSLAQTVSIERIKKIKDATVRIEIEDSESMGTGFIINEEGNIFTCWHVIQAAIKENNLNLSTKKIWVTIRDSIKVEYTIPRSFITDLNLQKNAILFDFVTLSPGKPIAFKSDYLKLGDFDSVKEGQQVITCGYPIGIPQKFVSQGIISTIYKDSAYLTDINGNRSQIGDSRNQALLDLTMNRGNSGGAVILLGQTAEDDRVIGIASFIINPIGGMADELANYFEGKRGIGIMGVDPNLVFSMFTKFFASTSIGVSGAISINHIKSSLKLK